MDLYEKKKQAFAYLSTLEARLQAHVSSLCVKSELEKSNLKRPEDQVVAEIFFPICRTVTGEHFNLSERQLGSSMLLESYKKFASRFPNIEFPPTSSGARTLPHPFPKNLDFSPDQIYRNWLTGEKGVAMGELWLDFAVQIEDKLNVVFEAKLYKDSSGSPSSELTKGLSEANFYRGLAPTFNKDKLKWKPFEFACYIACDISKGHKLKQAFMDIPESVRLSFWESACVFPMILTGN